MAATIQKYGAPGVYDPPGYSQAIKVTGAQTILFLAGQVPYAPGGTVNHRGDFTAQARQVFGAVKSLVEAGGGTLANVVKITTYVTDVRYRMDFRVVRDEFFGPARAGLDHGAGRLAVAPRLHDRDRGAGRDLVTWGAPTWPPNLHGGLDMAPKPPALVTPRGTRGAPRFCVHRGPPPDSPRPTE